MIDQNLADSLIRLRKRRINDAIHDLGQSKLIIQLVGETSPQEEFLLDIHKASIRIEQHGLNKRVRKSIGLVRVDLGSTLEHSNPDGSKIIGSHMHIFKEGYDLKWAVPLPYSGALGTFQDQGNLLSNFDQFCQICNIVEPPILQGGLL
ncbi:MAG: hypothetical protein KDD61_10155 [Bdellovibrionales bacterium]|nr:hypothetical protein [Bdellovibrionales bacterium]